MAEKIKTHAIAAGLLLLPTICKKKL